MRLHNTYLGVRLGIWRLSFSLGLLSGNRNLNESNFLPLEKVLLLNVSTIFCRRFACVQHNSALFPQHLAQRDVLPLRMVLQVTPHHHVVLNNEFPAQDIPYRSCGSWCRNWTWSRNWNLILLWSCVHSASVPTRVGISKLELCGVVRGLLCWTTLCLCSWITFLKLLKYRHFQLMDFICGALMATGVDKFSVAEVVSLFCFLSQYSVFFER